MNVLQLDYVHKYTGAFVLCNIVSAARKGLMDFAAYSLLLMLLLNSSRRVLQSQCAMCTANYDSKCLLFHGQLTIL